MARFLKIAAAFILIFLLSGCMATQSDQPDLTSLDVINNVEGDLIIRRLSENIWLFTAYRDEASKNGVLIEGEGGIGVIDPPENPDQAERLNALVGEYFDAKIVQALWTGRILSGRPVYQLYRDLNAELYVPEPVARDENLEDAKVFIPNNGELLYAGQRLQPLCFREDGALDELHVSLWMEGPKLLYAGPNLISMETEVIMTPVYETKIWETIVSGLENRVPEPAVVVSDKGAAGDAQMFSHTKSLLLQREFTLNYGAAKLPLRKTFEDEKILEIFGKPEKTEESVLGIGADTFSGSRIRNFSFNKTQVTLFAPPNGQSFWLMGISTRDPRFSTTRGVNIGESLALLMLKYPDAVPVPNEMTDPGNMDYVYDHGTQGEYALYFEVRTGFIDRIRLEYTLR